MTEPGLNTPVALIIFNRVSTTKKVFEVVREMRPSKLLLIADGPRLNQDGEAERCKSVRSIVECVDWDCEVLKNYSDVNLGCGLRPATGIDWVFKHVDKAIILEDDCLPHPSFFRFCEVLLDKYKDDEQVMHISGTNFLFNKSRIDKSYFFSRFPFCWGWATWRRAWNHYDYYLTKWPEVNEDKEWLYFFGRDEKSAQHYWETVFNNTYLTDKSHIWDFQWNLACWLQKGLSIVPNVNLVSNIGFGAEATHTQNATDMLKRVLRLKNDDEPQHGFNPVYNFVNWVSRLTDSRFSNLPANEIYFPLNHPKLVSRNIKADNYLQFNNYQGGHLGWLKRRIKAMMKYEHK